MCWGIGSAAGDGRQNKPEGSEHRLGSKDWDPSVMSGGTLSRIHLNINFWVLNCDGTLVFGSLWEVCVVKVNNLQSV